MKLVYEFKLFGFVILRKYVETGSDEPTSVADTNNTRHVKPGIVDTPGSAADNLNSFSRPS